MLVQVPTGIKGRKGQFILRYDLLEICLSNQSRMTDSTCARKAAHQKAYLRYPPHK